MTPDDINKMWLQSQNDAEGVRLGFTTQQHYFAALVAAAEREACAEICESKKSLAASYFEINEYLQECADEIRARSNA